MENLSLNITDINRVNDYIVAEIVVVLNYRAFVIHEYVNVEKDEDDYYVGLCTSLRRVCDDEIINLKEAVVNELMSQDSELDEYYAELEADDIIADLMEDADELLSNYHDKAIEEFKVIAGLDYVA